MVISPLNSAKCSYEENRGGDWKIIAEQYQACYFQVCCMKGNYETIQHLDH